MSPSKKDKPKTPGNLKGAGAPRGPRKARNTYLDTGHRIQPSARAPAPALNKRNNHSGMLIDFGPKRVLPASRPPHTNVQQQPAAPLAGAAPQPTATHTVHQQYGNSNMAALFLSPPSVPPTSNDSLRYQSQQVAPTSSSGSSQSQDHATADDFSSPMEAAASSVSFDSLPQPETQPLALLSEGPCFLPDFGWVDCYNHRLELGPN